MPYQLIFDFTVVAALACCMCYSIKNVRKEAKYTTPLVFFTVMLVAFTLFLAAEGQIRPSGQMLKIFVYTHVVIRDISVFGSIVFTVSCAFVSYAKKTIKEWVDEERQAD